MASIQNFIPAGLEVVVSNHDTTLVTYISQVLSVTSNLSNNEGVKLFSDPLWEQISENFSTSIGMDRVKLVGYNVFLLYHNEVPVLARIEGSGVVALDPRNMASRYAVMAHMIDDIYKYQSGEKSISGEMGSTETIKIADEPKKPAKTRSRKPKTV